MKRNKYNSYVHFVLVLLLGFTIPIGGKTSIILGMNVSIIFSAVVFLSIVYIFTIKRKLDKSYFPSGFIYLFGCILFNIVITYAIIYPERLFIKNFTDSEIAIIKIFRYLVLWLLVISISILVFNYKYFKLFYKAFFFSYLLTFVVDVILPVGNYNVFEDGVRLSGGFLDPNEFAFMSLILFILTLIHFRQKNKKSKYKFFILLILTLGILLTQSRSGVFSLVIILSIYFVKSIRKSNILHLFLLISFSIGTILIILPDRYYVMVEKRLQTNDNSNSDNSSRLSIWSDYWIALNTRVLVFGSGHDLARDNTVNNYSTLKNYVTHNEYLRMIVEYGIFVFLLYISNIYILFIKILKLSNRASKVYNIVLPFFLVFIMEQFFFDTLYSRSYWVSLSVLITISYNKKLFANENIIL